MHIEFYLVIIICCLICQTDWNFCFNVNMYLYCKLKILLRNVLGTKNLGDILSERESIAHDMQVHNVHTVHMYSIEDIIKNKNGLGQLINFFA